MELGRVADLPEGCADIQRGINRLEKWASGNLKECSNGKCKVPHQGEEQPQVPAHVRGHLARKQLCKKGPGGPGGNQVDHEPAMCPCSKEG